MKLSSLLKDFYKKDLINTDLLEAQYASVNELQIDGLNSYSYKEYDFIKNNTDMIGANKAWEFQDRCGNRIVAVYLESINEFKSGFKVEGINKLIFDPSTFPNGHDLIRPCPDDRRVNTVFKILAEEVIPRFLLNKKPNKLSFNPVSKSRNRLVDMIINKVLERFPQLTKRNNYLIYV